jgi:hypothetical protein
MQIRSIFICDVCVSIILFPRDIINSTLLEREIIIEYKKCVVNVSTDLSNISHAVKNWARYDQKSILGFM